MKSSTEKVEAQIDTAKNRTVMDFQVAKDLGLLKNLENYKPEKNTLKIKFNLKDKRIQTIVDLIDLNEAETKFIIGNRDLNDFLIDPQANKEPKKDKPVAPKEVISKRKINYEIIDKKIMEINDQISFLHYIKPINVKDEHLKFIANEDYNPQFQYKPLNFNSSEIIEKLTKISLDDSPLGVIFNKKRDEIIKKVNILETRGSNIAFTSANEALYGIPSQDEVAQAEQIIANKRQSTEQQKEDLVTAEELKIKFEKVLAKYGLNNWKVELSPTLVARCTIAKNDSILIRSSATFTPEQAKNLIIHEIETHVLTAENGKLQLYDIFKGGMANYLFTQEGLAVYNVNKQNEKQITSDGYQSQCKVLAINTALNYSFSESIKVFRKKYDFGAKKAFKEILRAKRGVGDSSKPGAFTKDLVYVKGLRAIQEYVSKGGKIKDLYLGKINIEDLPMIKKIPGIRPPQILPKWLKE